MPVHVALAIPDEPRAAHAWVMDDGRGSLTRQLMVLLAPRAKERQPPLELLVVGGDALAVRVRVEDERVRALVWFPRSSLALAATRRVAVAADPRDIERTSAWSLTLLPGARVELGSLRGRARRVHGSCEQLTFDGWVSDDALGDIFEAEPTPRSITVDGLLNGGAVVYAAPGAAIGRLGDRGSGQINVLVKPDAPPGFAAVRWLGDRCIVDALVDAREVSATPPSQLETGLGSLLGLALGSMSDSVEITLPPGKSLMTPEGERIGITRAPTTAFLSARRSGVCDVSVLLPMLGFQELRVRCL